jgi:hypothetical protein
MDLVLRFTLFMFVRDRGVTKLNKHMPYPPGWPRVSTSMQFRGFLTPNRSGRFFTGDFCLIFSQLHCLFREDTVFCRILV